MLCKPLFIVYGRVKAFLKAVLQYKNKAPPLQKWAWHIHKHFRSAIFTLILILGINIQHFRTSSVFSLVLFLGEDASTLCLLQLKQKTFCLKKTEDDRCYYRDF